MARPSVPASIIAQRGKKITLLDDSEVAVVFTFSSIMRLEEDFGSIAGALVAVKAGEQARAFSAVADILAAGLEHETYGDDGLSLSDVENLRAVLDPARFSDYSDALGAALDAAFPKAEGGDSADDDEADPTKDSRGESGTTSRQSRSDEVTTTSGA